MHSRLSSPVSRLVPYLELSRILVSPPPVSFSLLTIILVLEAATAMLAAHTMFAEE